MPAVELTRNVLAAWLRPALAAAGLGLSLWLLRQSTAERGLPGCGAGSGCDAVTRSRWSRWCGIHVAAPASLVYLLLIVGLTLLNLSPGTPLMGMASTLQFPAALLLAAAATWFIGLQWVVIRRFCLYCVLLHAIGFGLAASILFGPTIGEPPGIGGWLVAGVGVLALLLGQVLVKPRMYVVRAAACGERPVPGKETRVTETALSPRETASAPRRATDRSPLAASRSNPFASRKIIALNGQVFLDAGPWPVLGSPGAPHVVVCLFDYTCEPCWKLHGLLVEALRENEDLFSIMLVPVPQHPNCNVIVYRMARIF